jgi:hypothetical protein
MKNKTVQKAARINKAARIVPHAAASSIQEPEQSPVITKTDGKIAALVTCEVSKVSFDGVIRVNVIEKAGSQYIKRVVSWRDNKNNFNHSEWQDFPVKTETLYLCKNIVTGFPVDPYYFRKAPQAFKRMMEESSFKALWSEYLKGTETMLFAADGLPDIINICCQSILIKDDPCVIPWDKFTQDCYGSVSKIEPASPGEIASFEYRINNGIVEVPKMAWHSKKSFPNQEVWLVPIAEPLEGKTNTDSEKQQGSANDSVSKPCTICGWIHSRNFTKWTCPETGKVYKVRAGENQRRVYLEKLHKGMSEDGGETAIESGPKGLSASKILGEELHKALYLSTSGGFARIRKPGEVKKLGRHPKR